MCHEAGPGPCRQDGCWPVVVPVVLKIGSDNELPTWRPAQMVGLGIHVSISQCKADLTHVAGNGIYMIDLHAAQVPTQYTQENFQRNPKSSAASKADKAGTANGTSHQ